MVTISVPAGADCSDVEWSLDTPAQVNRSAWSGARKVIGLPGAERWFATSALTPVSTETDERPLRAFILACRGPANTFRLPAACSQRSGTNPTVRTGANAGRTLPLQGLPPSTTVLVAGQFMTVPLPSGHERLVCLTADLASNGAGQGTATFSPMLGEVPTAGATVETIAPWALMALTNSRQGWKTEGGQTAFMIEAEEAK